MKIATAIAICVLFTVWLVVHLTSEDKTTPAANAKRVALTADKAAADRIDELLVQSAQSPTALVQGMPKACDSLSEWESTVRVRADEAFDNIRLQQLVGHVSGATLDCRRAVAALNAGSDGIFIYRVRRMKDKLRNARLTARLVYTGG